MPLEIFMIILTYLPIADLTEFRKIAKRYQEITTACTSHFNNIEERAVRSIYPYHVAPVSQEVQNLIIKKIAESLLNTSLGKCSAYIFYSLHRRAENAHEWENLSHELKSNTKLQVKAVRAPICTVKIFVLLHIYISEHKIK